MRSSMSDLPYSSTAGSSSPELRVEAPTKLAFGEVSHTFGSLSRWWDPLSALFLAAALFTAASRLIATEWVEHLDITRNLAVLGVLAGLALGQSRFSPRLVTVFALAYGLFFIPWRLALTLEYLAADTLWGDRLLILAGRLFIAISQLAHQELVQDPLLFLFWITSLFWILSVHAGYTLTRHAHLWRAILPTGLALLIIQNSDPYIAPRIWALAIYFFFALLLLARLTYQRNYARWQETHTRVPPLITLDFTRVILYASALLILIAWLVPALTDTLPTVREAWQEVTRPWFSAIGERLDKAFASLRRTAVTFTAVDYYGHSLSLGRGGELPDTLVLTVQGPSKGRAGGVRYYWRARVYDHYADGQWSSATFSTTQSIRPTGIGLTFPELDERRTFTFTFTTASPIVTLYAAPQPEWVSLPARAELARNYDGTADVSAWRVAPPLAAGMTYQVRSSLSTVTIAQLRDAGTDYPQWVTNRYLQLPLTITPRTRELAREIAGDLDNPYDIATAVTSYLRASIIYTETIPLPPVSTAGRRAGEEQELLDWFLFDLRRGFCNYYASAQVIMLRSLGVPARLAVGFAEGEYQSGADIYLVRRRDAHAWPEVYFPNLGWVEFEPTASQSPLNRPLGESESDDGAADSALLGGGGGGEGMDYPMDRLLAADEEAFAGPGGSASILGSRGFWVPWAVVLLAIGVLATAFVQRTRRRRGSPPLVVSLEAGIRRIGLQPPKALRLRARRAVLSPLTRAYLELNYALARLDAPPAPADTPAERAAALTGLLPAAAEPVQQLLGEYQATIYGPRPGSLYAAQRAANAVRNLSWQSKVRRLVARYKPDSLFP
jgi:transglutaminase-like putative cysteine protease